MEGRKLQLVGGSTYQVSLPRRWVADRGLKAGDLLYIEAEGDGTVCVRADAASRSSTERKVFDVSRAVASDHLLRKLIGAYVANFRLIELRYSARTRTSARDVAREFCRLVNGPEIIDESATHLVLQDFSNGTELSPARCLRRMHLVVRAMLTEALLALRDGDAERSRDVSQHDEDLNRLSWIVAKNTSPTSATVRLGIDDSAPEAPYYRLVALLLECTGEQAVELARNAVALRQRRELDVDLMNALESSASAVVDTLEKVFDAFFSKDSELANEAIDSCRQLEDSLDQLPGRLSSHRGIELLELSALVENLGRSASYAREIAKQALDVAVLREPAEA